MNAKIKRGRGGGGGGKGFFPQQISRNGERSVRELVFLLLVIYKCLFVLFQIQTEVYDSGDYRNYFNLVSHHSERKTGDMFHRAMFTIFLLR